MKQAPLIADRNTLMLLRDIEEYPGGIVIPLDKPYRWTSADVVRKVKYAAIRHFGKKNLKVGHAGTLDPLATGILIICIGNATKIAEELQSHDKEYIAGIRFGATTPSYDLEKEIDRTFPYGQITADRIKETLSQFIGKQEQIAPLFSAKSVDGVRAYELARKLYRQNGGAGMDDAAKELLRTSVINISEAELMEFRGSGPEAIATGSESIDSSISKASSRINVADTSLYGYLPSASVRIVCSKGTYIRAFARDLGESLESGAYLESLCRTRSGNFSICDAPSLEHVLSILD